MKNLLCFLLLPIFSLAQQKINSKEFFPTVNTLKPEQVQTIKITDQDTVEFVTHKYNFITENKKSYLVSTTFDPENLITSYLKEEITKKGLRYISGKNYIYDDTNNPTVYNVKGKKKITFPFKNLDELGHWKTTLKNTFDNKVVVVSKIEYLGFENLNFQKQDVQALKFKRTVVVTYKKEYEKEKISYEYLWYFVKGLGMFKYTKIGNIPFEGVIVKSE